jgi:hypothetical protein
LSDGRTVRLNDSNEYQAALDESAFYPRMDKLLVSPELRGRFSTRVSVEGGDCLEVARRVSHELGETVAVLNRAGRNNPGG